MDFEMEHEKKPTGKKQSKHCMEALEHDADADCDETDSDSDSLIQQTKHSLLSFQDGHPLADSHGTRCHLFQTL